MLLHLLGTPYQQTASGLIDLPMRRASWILFYLAYYQTWMRREELIFFLRPDADREVASLYLRKLLNDARKLSWADGLEVEADRLRWSIGTDVTQFQTAAREGRWFEAVQLYRGPLLQGLDASYLPGYKAWLDSERAALEHIWRDVTLHYADDLEASEHHRDAAAAAKKLLQHDSLDEEAVHSYLRNTYLSGQRQQSLGAAHSFIRELRTELDLEPTAATLALIEAIQMARPLPRIDLHRKYGRRRSDRRGLAEFDAEQLNSLVDLLADPSARLLNLNPNGAQGTLIISKLVPDVQIVLDAVIVLAERLSTQGHRRRALELLTQVLGHPACSTNLKTRAEALYTTLLAQLHNQSKDTS